MSNEYQYPYESGWNPASFTDSGAAKIMVAAPKWDGYWARTVDNPSEFRLVSAGNLEAPTTWSIKRDTVGDIYRTHPYIAQGARVANRQGVRLSFAYKETGLVTDTAAPLDYHILPLSMTINCTIPVSQVMSQFQREQFIGRALGAFVGAATSETGEHLYLDFESRWAGDLRPRHFRDTVE